MKEIALAVGIAILGSGGLWGFLQFLLDSKFKKRSETLENINAKLDKVVTSQEMEELRSDIKSLKEDVYHAKELSMGTARDRINNLCNKYNKLGFIPYDEYVSFKAIGESYVSAGGNTEVKTKFNWALENLEVKSEL